MEEKKAILWIKENWLLVLIILAGIAVRAYEFGDVPPGIDQDEVSAGYDAYSIYEYGIDRNGYHYPLIFKGFGAGQNSLHQYLSIPFIAVFGLNKYSIRAVDLLFGIIALIVFYLLVKEIFNRKTALFAAFLLAVCPWHTLLSRWGLEENLFPVFFLIANLFLVYSLRKQAYLPVSFLFFALSLYSHNSAYFIVPVFVLLSSIYLVAHKKVKLKVFFLSAAVFCIVALPVLAYVLINTLDLDPISTPFFSIPKTSVARFTESMIFRGDFSSIKNNLNAFINLVIRQNGSLTDSLPPYGFIYPIGMPLALIGLVIISKKQRITTFEKSTFVLLWLFLAFILCLLAGASGHRLNIVFFPLIILASAGALFVKDRIHPYLFYLMTILFLLFFASFTHAYFTEYPAKASPVFFESFDEAIAYATSATKGQICITNTVNMPYIYLLFHEKTDPNKFMETVEYYDTAAMWQWVKKYDRYYFGPEGCKLATAPEVYIFHESESRIFTPDKFDITRFKMYGVGIRRYYSQNGKNETFIY
jgi:asparagine N-glycosylation enzyme membrane subunit Stt3